MLSLLLTLSILSPPASTLQPAALTRAALVLASRQDELPAGPAVLESDACSLCHSNHSRAEAMRDRGGRGVAPFDLWRGTMMANAARDPLWRAAVSREVAATPTRRAEIEAECLRCHAPMAHVMGLAEHDTGSLMHTVDCGERLGELARDGVSCTICHGIDPASLAGEASFSGHFELDPHMRLYGPHAEPRINPMQFNTGFTPTQGAHVTSSKLCASCHTLRTHAFDAAGEARAEPFLEQAPYLEWRNSIFNDELEQPGAHAQSCQGCHLPTRGVDGRELRTPIARAPGGFDFGFTTRRRPFGRHLLVGGNAFMLGILRDNAEQLAVTAPAAAFDASIAATREQLRHRSARVEVVESEREGDALRFRVRVENLSGHKLPTGHPIRRAWLRVRVRDQQGELLFHSGASDARGRLVDERGQVLASELADGPPAAHVDRVTRSDQVASYQAIMADAEGRPTSLLTRGVRWLRDDRLLPRGWRAAHPDGPATAPVGIAGDDDFVGGADEVRYELKLPASGTLTIEAELVYQAVSARWAAELFASQTAEARRFQQMFEAADHEPELMARDVQRVD